MRCCRRRTFTHSRPLTSLDTAMKCGSDMTFAKGTVRIFLPKRDQHIPIRPIWITRYVTSMNSAQWGKHIRFCFWRTKAWGALKKSMHQVIFLTGRMLQTVARLALKSNLSLTAPTTSMKIINPFFKLPILPRPHYIWGRALDGTGAFTSFSQSQLTSNKKTKQGASMDSPNCHRFYLSGSRTHIFPALQDAQSQFEKH